MIRSHWFDRHREYARDQMTERDGCNVGLAFLLLTVLLVLCIVVSVQIGVL